MRRLFVNQPLFLSVMHVVLCQSVQGASTNDIAFLTDFRHSLCSPSVLYTYLIQSSQQNERFSNFTQSIKFFMDGTFRSWDLSDCQQLLHVLVYKKSTYQPHRNFRLVITLIYCEPILLVHILHAYMYMHKYIIGFSPVERNLSVSSFSTA